MTLVYAIFATMWGWLCYQHQHELLPIQALYLFCITGLTLTRVPYTFTVLPFWPCELIAHRDGRELGYSIHFFSVHPNLTSMQDTIDISIRTAEAQRRLCFS